MIEDAACIPVVILILAGFLHFITFAFLFSGYTYPDCSWWFAFVPLDPFFWFVFFFLWFGVFASFFITSLEFTD